MNCREVTEKIFAERDGALDSAQRAALEQHVAGCADCQKACAQFASAIAHWRHENRSVVVPDAEREWYELRREIRGANAPQARPRRNLLTWLATPLAAAAAIAVALLMDPADSSPNGPGGLGDGRTARVAQNADRDAEPTTTVFVDDKSGWTVVWVSNAGSKQI